MIHLRMRDGNVVSYDSHESLLLTLAEDAPMQNKPENVETSQFIREWVAHKFRGIVQSKSISEYPMATVLNINEDDRNALYGHDLTGVTSWHTLPPLVVVCPPERAPEGSLMDNEDTVWVLDTTSNASLLESLRLRGALDWFSEEEPAW